MDVEPEHHRRIAHDGLEQYVEPAECVVAEELVLRQHHAVVLLRDLRQARRQQPVPEQRRAFDQRPLGGHETRHPRSDHVDRLLHVEVQVRDGRVGGAVLDRRLAQQIIDHLFERHVPVALDIRGQRDERRAPQQVPQARIGVVERVRSRTGGRLLDRRRTLLRRVRSAAALVHDDAGRRAARRQHRRRGAGAGEEPRLLTFTVPSFACIARSSCPIIAQPRMVDVIGGERGCKHSGKCGVGGRAVAQVCGSSPVRPLRAPSGPQAS